MKGRRGVMIGIRVSEDVNTILKELAQKRGVTVSAFVKGKVEEYATRVVNTIPDMNKGTNAVNTKVIGGVRYRLKV